MTLTQTAVITKNTIHISIIALVLGIVSFIGYRIWYANYLANLPPVEEKPDLKFGLLPKLDLPAADVSSSNFTYSLDTVTGNVPKFDKLIKVFFITKPYATLLSGEKSQILAKKFGFASKPQILSETKYLYRQEELKNMVVDLDSGNFIYTSLATPSAQEAVEDNKLISDFRSLLSEKGLSRNEISPGRTKVTPVKITDDKIVVSKTRADSNGYLLSVWPNPVDQKPIFTANPNKALINAVISPTAADLNNYISIEYTFWPVDNNTFATYPIKSGETALAQLKNGEGTIIIPPSTPKVSITAVYLGYYESEQYTPYLQPVYVFEGPDFVGVIPAIADEFVLP